ncbi:MAG: septum formation inhibitor Maf [Campylobacteraceae bacterium]|jgi:septum formation protein|nr:septum formation inhibitor Maf [Campylobacteraceae bacterium]
MIALGSSSSTRAKILKDTKIAFIQRAFDFDENIVKYENAYDLIYKIAKGKAARYLEIYPLDMPFIVADTVVIADGRILGKAHDINEARDMLYVQSGSIISIITCMIYKSLKLEFTDLSAASYEFDKFKSGDLETYLEGGEWQGKAGACMVEGFCKPYIKSVHGLESTAMGLSIEKLLPFLELK